MMPSANAYFRSWFADMIGMVLLELASFMLSYFEFIVSWQCMVSLEPSSKRS